MKKEIKGKPKDILDQVEDWYQNLSEKEMSKNYKGSISDLRTLDQNSFLHKMLRVISEHTGEEDIEQLKKDLKYAIGYSNDVKVETQDGTFITRIYEKTSEMNSKELSLFIQKLEAFCVNQFGINFEYLKKDLKN